MRTTSNAPCDWKSTRRRAFTLVELLTVIAILGVLVALGTWGTFAMIGAQQRKNTNLTVNVVNKMLQERWAAVIAEASKEPPSPAVVALAMGDPKRAKVIWIKVRLAEAFPMTYAEVQAPPAPPPAPQTLVYTYIPPDRRKPYFAKYQQTVGTTTGGGVGETSACLLMALRTLKADAVALDDQLKYAIRDTDGDGQPEFVDGWGRPLAFVRFPWNNSALQAANPGLGSPKGAMYADPIDTDGMLINPTWYNFTPPAPMIPPRVIYESTFHPVKTSGPNAYYVTPVIVSAGPDGVMGIAPDLSAGAGSADNIFSFQLKRD